MGVINLYPRKSFRLIVLVKVKILRLNMLMLKKKDLDHMFRKITFVDKKKLIFVKILKHNNLKYI